MKTASALAMLFVTVSCAHFRHEPVRRGSADGHLLTLSHTRVCETENDPIKVKFAPPLAAEWSIINEAGESVRKGAVHDAFSIDPRGLSASRYTLAIPVTASDSLQANFEVFRCDTL